MNVGGNSELIRSANAYADAVSADLEPFQHGSSEYLGVDGDRGLVKLGGVGHRLQAWWNSYDTSAEAVTEVKRERLYTAGMSYQGICQKFRRAGAAQGENAVAIAGILGGVRERLEALQESPEVTDVGSQRMLATVLRTVRREDALNKLVQEGVSGDVVDRLADADLSEEAVARVVETIADHPSGSSRAGRAETLTETLNSMFEQLVALGGEDTMPPGAGALDESWEVIKTVRWADSKPETPLHTEAEAVPAAQAGRGIPEDTKARAGLRFDLSALEKEPDRRVQVEELAMYQRLDRVLDDEHFSDEFYKFPEGVANDARTLYAKLNALGSKPAVEQVEVLADLASDGTIALGRNYIKVWGFSRDVVSKAMKPQ